MFTLLWLLSTPLLFFFLLRVEQSPVTLLFFTHSFTHHSLRMASQFPTLTFDEAKIALDEVIAAFDEPEAKAKVRTALLLYPKYRHHHDNIHNII